MKNNSEKKYIAVFCGSQSGDNELYAVHAAQVGKLLAENGFGLVYGGGKAGLMGAVADAVIAANGQVTGIIPVHLKAKERHHEGVNELLVVNTMHERKALMYSRCEAAIILPGGYGTMDEFFEMITWNQLALHNKPIFVLNTAGFYTDLLQLLHTMHARKFLYLPFQEAIMYADLPATLIELMKNKIAEMSSVSKT